MVVKLCLPINGSEVASRVLVQSATQPTVVVRRARRDPRNTSPESSILYFHVNPVSSKLHIFPTHEIKCSQSNCRGLGSSSRLTGSGYGASA